jgi:hypothetical protein
MQGGARLVAGNTGAGVYKDTWPREKLLVSVSQVRRAHGGRYRALRP